MLAREVTSHGATLRDAKSNFELTFGAGIAVFVDLSCCFALMREIVGAATGSGFSASASEAELSAWVGDSLRLFLAPDCASRISWSDAPDSLYSEVAMVVGVGVGVSYVRSWFRFECLRNFVQGSGALVLSIPHLAPPCAKVCNFLVNERMGSFPLGYIP
jgi:hypothetical protein